MTEPIRTTVGGGSGRPTILVVEDDPSNRALLGYILRREGYAVIHSEDGLTALDAVGRERPDLVLLDVGLPGLDGYEVTRRIREDRRDATLPVLLLTGRTSTSDVVQGLDAGADDFITKPFAEPELVARIRTALRLRRALVGMEAAHAIVTALANAVEAKDVTTERHCQRLAGMGARLGARLGIGPVELDALAYGALLHDVGKIGVPDAILTKPAPLTEDEWALVRRHPEIGERICAPLESFASFGPIIRHHHERWDGQGYPDGLVGAASPLGARIVGIVDSFDAMTHERPYRAALEFGVAVDELTRAAGRQFDPELVRLFLDEITESPLAAGAETETFEMPSEQRPVPGAARDRSVGATTA
ncbi:MAG TPA: HD domain-containing phosphohydrolase [Candidatus Limnocylindrales bacterium]|nr:HD domain-containing phosphohydrolase [Candidatus Limnocylindrales bacterium]